MSRLLFAVARGARVQRQQEAVYSNRTWWEDAQIQWGMDDELRIHPDDEHLQYGPISTALRDIAAHPSYELAHTDEFGTWSLLYKDWCNCCDLASERDVSLFLLILAEALADEGL
jgi:hypothetical protein